MPSPASTYWRIAPFVQQWRDLLHGEACAALDNGELPTEAEPAQLAYELGVILAGTNLVAALHNDNNAIERVRSAIRARLDR